MNFFPDDPQQVAMMGLAARLMQAGGPSPRPVSFGQGLGQSWLGAQNDYATAQQAAIVRKIHDTQLRKAEQELSMLERQQRVRDKSAKLAERFVLDSVQSAAPSLDTAGVDSKTGLAGTLLSGGLQGAYGQGSDDMAKMGIGMLGYGGEKQEPFTLSPGQTRYNAQGKPIASGGPDTQNNFKHAESLRDNYNTLTKDFRTVNDSYSRIKASGTNPSAAGDLSLIYNYMKMLDPGSVVRESEFATAAATGSYGAQIQAYVQRALNGQRLAPEIRSDFMQRAAMLYQSQNRNYEQIRNQYGEVAKRAGIDPADVLTEFRAPEAERKAVRTGTVNGRRVVQYSDGSIEYADKP